MKTKRVAIQNARKFTVASQYMINWGSVLLISMLLLVISCTKNDDLETIGNEPPIANSGANQTIILPTNFVDLDGSVSTDTDNPIISYSWSKISGPAAYDFTNANTAQTHVTNLVEGVYQFELTVTNALGLSGKDTITISVIQNITSIYGSSNDINLMLPQDWVVLDNSFIGSSSNVTGMEWKKINGPATDSLAYSYNLEYTYIYGLVEGSYQFELTVNHVNGSVSKDTTNVNLYDVSIIPQNAKEIIIENVQWIFPWWSTLEIADFYRAISRESLFRIFVKRDGSTNWEDVPALSKTLTYNYFIERRPDGAGMYLIGSLYILYIGSDPYPSDTPDIKIVYW